MLNNLEDYLKKFKKNVNELAEFFLQTILFSTQMIG